MRILLNCSLQIFSLLCSLLFSYIGISNTSTHSYSSFFDNGYQNRRSLAEINSTEKEKNYELNELGRNGANLMGKLKMYRRFPQNTNLHMSLLSMNTNSYPTYGNSSPSKLELHQGSKLIDHSQKGILLGSFLHTHGKKPLTAPIVPKGNTQKLRKFFEESTENSEKPESKNMTKYRVTKLRRKFESEDIDDED